ncbi:MAG: hypothetical protein JW754_03150 [Candidatus Aenigmarchaeota archaeon]|nr:hypothetical protein [Candidatus Aenigmarchaeota archaeon]
MQITKQTVYRIAWICLVAGIIFSLLSFVFPQTLVLGLLLISVWVILAVYWVAITIKENGISARTYAKFGIIFIAIGMKIILLPDLYSSLNWIFGIVMAVGIVLLLIAGVKKFNDRQSREFNVSLSVLGLIALLLIMAGIIVNVVCTFLFPELVGIGNYFFVAGFGIGAIGLFLYVIKKKAFK